MMYDCSSQSEWCGSSFSILKKEAEIMLSAVDPNVIDDFLLMLLTHLGKVLLLFLDPKIVLFQCVTVYVPLAGTNTYYIRNKFIETT